jgi:hypothetical protein
MALHRDPDLTATSELEALLARVTRRPERVLEGVLSLRHDTRRVRHAIYFPN